MVSLYLLTDCHYVSKKNWVEGKPFTSRERGDQICLRFSPEILDTFINRIIDDKETDTVVFQGDNVNSGDMTSHYEFRERLDKLKAAGKKVYMIPATHDYCSCNGEDECFQKGSVRYTETGTEPVEVMPRSGLYDFYKDYGPAQALSVDEESRSYSVRISDKVRLIAICDNGNGRSHCGLFESGMKWLAAQIKEAKDAGEYVLLMTHHPVISPWDVYAHMADFEMYGGYKELSNLMCEEGVRVIFTGHTHVQNIRKYTGVNGNYFYDVSTVSLVNAAGKMRMVTVDTEKGICDVSSIGIDKIDGVDTGDKSAYEYLYSLNFTGLLENSFPLIFKDYDAFLDSVDGFLPVDKLAKHRGLVRFACKKLSKMKLSTLAKLGGGKKKLSKEQFAYSKTVKVIDTAFAVCRHIFPGNAPYPQDTAENIVIGACAAKLDRIVSKFKIEALQKVIPPGSSLSVMAQDFLCNTRTGDDDSITINLA